MNVIDAILEAITWIGFGGAAFFGMFSLVVWAADGSWQQADAIVDRDGGHPVVRWFMSDGGVGAATPTDAEARLLEGRDAAVIWYRVGRSDRMRLTRRPPGLRALWIAAAALAIGALVCTAASWIRYFTVT
ncbi:hypothetical protein [Microbacterium sp. No. 7]|uniref:hypothetical protein n=1 Tax=Microbacterium sp. No. 7 TaxID=1714373 RepID=UPI0006D2A8EF|nr:hypothetical protein [Microbacterium sp. No. 7]ALJ19591.1 hypothetical protein AOA12_06575 [Microbacterium sp. No. 7]